MTKKMLSTMSYDFQRGYEDRKAHYYDKWYRYNREDGGAEYSRGCRACADETHSKSWLKADEHFTIIDCAYM